MQVSERRAQIGVAFVRADGQRSGGGYGEIDARHRDVGPEELRAQRLPCGVRQIGRVAVARPGPQLAFEQRADLLAPYADGRQHDVAGRQAEQLHDPFAEVALDGVDAAFAQEGRQAALLGEHRLALDEVPSAVFADETPYGVVHLGGVARPVHRDAVGRGVALEFEQVVAQTAQRVAFDFGGELPQLLPFGDRLHHPVAFFAYGVERPVVPRHAVGVGDESLCG